MQLVSLSHICPCLSTPAPSRSPSRHPCRSGARVVKGIKAKLEHLWAYAPERHPAAYLTKSFNPQRALRNTGLRLTRSAAKDFLLDRLSKRGRRPHLKTGPRWRTKRAVMRRIRSLKGLGRFQASNFWRYYASRFPTYPRAEHNDYVDTGPGARCGLNFLFPSCIRRRAASASFFLMFFRRAASASFF